MKSGATQVISSNRDFDKTSVQFKLISIQPSWIIGELGLTIKLKVGKKGYIILPKAIREAVGIDEGDEVIVEIKDGIVIKPAKRKVDEELLRTLFKKHVDTLRSIPNRREPEPGELAGVSLEEEFEN